VTITARQPGGCHATAGVLRDAVLPEDLLLDNAEDDTGSIAVLFGRAVSSRARAAGGFFAGAVFRSAQHPDDEFFRLAPGALFRD
jgi:aconitase B